MYLYGFNNDSGTTAAAAGGSTLAALQGSPFPSAVQWAVFVSSDHAGRFLVEEGSTQGHYLDPSSAELTYFVINGKTGDLTEGPGSPMQIPLGDSFRGAIDPAGRFLYIPNYDQAAGGGLDVYTIDQTSGAVAHSPGAPYPGPLTGYETTLINPSGTFLFEVGPPLAINAESKVVVWKLTQNGEASPVAGSPFQFSFNFSAASPNAAITPDGKYLLVTGNGQVTTLAIGSDGVPSFQGQTSLINNDGAVIAIDPMQRFAYVWGQSQNVLSVLKVAGGNTIFVPGSNIYCDNGSLAIDPTGHYLYATGALDTLVFSIDQTTGLLTQVSNSPAVKGGPSVLVTPTR